MTSVPSILSVGYLIELMFSFFLYNLRILNQFVIGSPRLISISSKRMKNSTIKIFGKVDFKSKESNSK